jgi:predicted ATPase with chaperone activity
VRGEALYKFRLVPREHLLRLSMQTEVAPAGVPDAQHRVLAGAVFLDELGLDGRLRRVPGVLPAVAGAAATRFGRGRAARLRC